MVPGIGPSADVSKLGRFQPSESSIDQRNQCCKHACSAIQMLPVTAWDPTASSCHPIARSPKSTLHTRETALQKSMETTVLIRTTTDPCESSDLPTSWTLTIVRLRPVRLNRHHQASIHASWSDKVAAHTSEVTEKDFEQPRELWKIIGSEESGEEQFLDNIVPTLLGA
jgi:hypothetical protein